MIDRALLKASGWVVHMLDWLEKQPKPALGEGEG